MRSWLALFENASGVHAMPGIAKPRGLEWDDEKMQAVLSLFPDFFQADDSAQYKHLLPLAISNSGIIGSEFSPERMGVRLRALEALVNLHLEVGTPGHPGSKVTTGNPARNLRHLRVRRRAIPLVPGEGATHHHRPIQALCCDS
jgi:hypothetical protein